MLWTVPRNATQPDDMEPSLERQAELEAHFQTNVEADNEPYYGVHIKTRGELRWIMQQRGWAGESSTEPDAWAKFAGAIFEAANLSHVHLHGADLSTARLRAVNLSYTDVSSAKLEGANLEGADLYETNLHHAILDYSNLSDAALFVADLSGAHLAACHMDDKTRLEGIILDQETRLVDVGWNGVSLTQVDWQQAPMIGEETKARTVRDDLLTGKKKSLPRRLHDYLDAARAYRQLVVALRSQGLNEDADRFAYRGHLMQRTVLRLQAIAPHRQHAVKVWYRVRKLGAYLWSWVVWGLTGYGYRPGNSILAYLFFIGGFALTYHAFGVPSVHQTYHLSWLESVVVSLTAFHGRGFFAQQYAPGDPQSILAAGEAVIGLVIEITFIATFTNRYFAR